MTADELLERVVAHAGGAERWASLQTLVVRTRASGLAFRTAGQQEPVADLEMRISVHEPRNELVSASKPGWRGVFEAGEARLTDADGRPTAARPGALTVRRLPWPGRWDDLDVVTFCGYAGWHYMTFPVRLRSPGVEVEALGERAVDGERLHGLRVRFPPATPAHSPEQVFWFTREGALRRNDYLARMVSPFAHAANRVLHERTVDGLTLPDRRRVTPQLPARRSAPGPVLVALELELLAARPGA